MDTISQNSQPINHQEASPLHPLETQSVVSQRPRKMSLGIGALVFVLLLATGAAGYYLGSMSGAKPDQALITGPTPTASPFVTPRPSPLASSTPSTAITASPSPAPTANPYPTGWKEHLFNQVGVKMAAPSNWKSDFQTFPSGPSSLIRFWQGASPDTATIQLAIKPDWSNTGDAQYLGRNFEIMPGLMAAKVDPPKLEEQKSDRYQTNYYFETNSAVYILNCVHNWIASQYQQCETMLRTGTFK